MPKQSKKLREIIGNRSKYVKIRVSDYEFDLLEKICIKKTITMAEYIRQKLFSESY